MLRVGCVHVKRSRDAPRWWGGRSDVLVGADQRAGGVCGTEWALSGVKTPLAPLLFGLCCVQGLRLSEGKRL